MVQSSVLLPVLGAPTTATWPALPDRSSSNGSCTWSAGRSTTPIGTRNHPCPAVPSSPSSGIVAASGRRPTWGTCPPAPVREPTSTARSPGPPVLGGGGGEPVGGAAAAGRADAGPGGRDAGRVGVKVTTRSPGWVPVGLDRGPGGGGLAAGGGGAGGVR